MDLENLNKDLQYDDRAIALITALELDESEISILKLEHDNVYSIGKREYEVLTDEEAEEAFEDSISEYLDQETPKHLRFYIDDELFKRDCNIDGRGAWLNHYDGNELEEKVNGIWYYIYRLN